MNRDMQDLQRFREHIAIARAEALRLGDAKLASILARSLVGVDLTIEVLAESYVRTLPQVEALKRLVGAT